MTSCVILFLDTEDGCEFSKSLSECLNLEIEEWYMSNFLTKIGCKY